MPLMLHSIQAVDLVLGIAASHLILHPNALAPTRNRSTTKTPAHPAKLYLQNHINAREPPLKSLPICPPTNQAPTHPPNKKTKSKSAKSESQILHPKHKP